MVKKLLISLFLVLGFLVVLPQRTFALETPYLSGMYKGGDAVWLSWTPVSGATYQVLYGPKSNPWVHGTVLGEGTTYTVKGLYRNTSYVFSVKAVRGGEVSSTSNWVWVTTGAGARAALPAKVAKPMPQPVAQAPVWATPGPVSGSVTVMWSEMPDGAYNVVYTDDPSVEKWGVVELPSSSRSYTIRGLVSGKTYWVWMSTRTSKRTDWVKVVAR